MEMIDLLHNRRSVRKYTADAVTEEQLSLILKAGLLSPTSHNSKPWHFIVVRDREGVREMGTHEELMKNSGIYRELYEYQFRTE